MGRICKLSQLNPEQGWPLTTAFGYSCCAYPREPSLRLGLYSRSEDALPVCSPLVLAQGLWKEILGTYTEFFQLCPELKRNHKMCLPYQRIGPFWVQASLDSREKAVRHVKGAHLC